MTEQKLLKTLQLAYRSLLTITPRNARKAKALLAVAIADSAPGIQQRAEKAAEIRKLTRRSSIYCPDCNSHEGFRYLEDISSYRDVTEIRRAEKILLINGSYRSDGYDDGCNFRLECTSCWTQFPIPKGYELEFI